MGIKKKKMKKREDMRGRGNLREMGEEMGLGIWGLMMGRGLGVLGMVWGMMREIVKGVLGVGIGVMVGMVWRIGSFGLMVWLLRV